MQSSRITIVGFALVILAIYEVHSLPSLKKGSKEITSCTLDEREQIPCTCCKKDCWYSIASAATHELGHMPGEAGEQEAMATLKLIRACMITECANLCSSVPF